MALLACLSQPQNVFKGSLVLRHQHKLSSERTLAVSLQCLSTPLSDQDILVSEWCTDWRFQGGCRITSRSNVKRLSLSKKWPAVCSCSMVGSQLASNAFTLGTAAVLPFYTLMVVAPKSEITKKAMNSSIPYAVLGLVYAYLLYLSWTPETIHLMFASKYWLPELPGIAEMFSSEMTLASAWIHLLLVDLFAARHIYHDGLKNEVETRHSVSLCLLVCPIGILIHTITKALTRTGVESSKHM